MSVQWKLSFLPWVLLIFLTTCLAVPSAAAYPSAAPSTSASGALCASQGSAPIQIPIRNVTLSDNNLRRGAALSIGTPAQAFAFLVSTQFNNTIVNDGTVPGCNVNSTSQECSTQYGGLFNEDSTSWNASTFSALDTAIETYPDQGSDLWGTETLELNSTFNIEKFPLGIFRSDSPNGGGTGNMNTLGVGRNSSLLNILTSVNAITSRTYGYFQGWTGAYTEYQTDGSLILGGYDAAKVNGSNITLPITPSAACLNGYIITVTDIKMNLRNGSNPSIIGSSMGSSLKACLQEDFGPLTLPAEIWWAFTNVTGVAEIGRSFSPLNFYGMLIPADGAYDGNLTLSIYPDLEITIPNHQLIVPDIEINSVGQQLVFNYSNEVEVLINSLQDINLNDMPRFGMPFLSSAYLMVDNDKEQFTLWASQQSQTSDIIELGPPPCKTPSSAVTPQPTQSPQPSNKSNGPSAGAIAGGTIGGVAIVALILAALMMKRKRRAVRRARASGPWGEPIVDSVYKDPPAYQKAELPSDQQPPQELSLSAEPANTLAPYELPPGPQRSSFHE